MTWLSQEDEELFARTMRGIMANINHLTNERDRSPTWKEDGWKKVVVCIVVDGRKVFNARTRAMLAALGVYQEGVAKNVVNGKPVVSARLRCQTRDQLMRLWIFHRLHTFTSTPHNVS
jgi:hypothetical protein